MKSSTYRTFLALSAIGVLTGCNDRPKNDGRVLNDRVVEGGGGTKVTAEIWVDNWFSLSVNGRPLIEDSVAFKTERSFNAERVTFNATLPMTIAFEFRDFVENDTGLEYIGSKRQQIGDGGAIAQFVHTDTGKPLKVTNATWKCQVIHQAPIDAACVKDRKPVLGERSCNARIDPAPAGWTAPDFDDSTWTSATEHLVSTVRPKGGYDQIRWQESAKLIWSKDLKLDNTVLCRTVIEVP